MLLRLIVALPFLLSAGVFAARVTEYSSDMVLLQGGQVMESTKLYVSGQKSRTEGLMGGQVIGIARRDRGVTYMLYPDQRVYTERPLTAARPGRPDLSTFDLRNLQSEYLGRENVLGYACTKMRVTMGNLPNNRPMLATVWVAVNLDLPIRLETMGMVQENRNLRIGPQRPTLFEIPAGYTKTSAPPGSGMSSGMTPPQRYDDRPTIGNRIDDALARLGGAGPSSKGGAPVAPSAGSRMEMNTNRMGGDYRTFELSGANPALCQAACDGEAQCVAWTYVKPGGPGERAQCWLKDTAMPPNPEDCCVSGVKGAVSARYKLERNVNRMGGDYRDFLPRTADPGLCAAACANESRCRSWSWVNADLEGPTGHCWLKSNVPPADKDDCCVSGLKP